MKRLLLLAFIFPSPVLAQPVVPPPCVVDAGLDRNVAAWRSPVERTRMIVVGEAARVPTAGPLTIEVAEAGAYGIALDVPAWIEVARDGAVLTSTGHGHGLACSSIRKIVDFALAPGRYTLTLRRTDLAAARILVFRR